MENRKYSMMCFSVPLREVASSAARAVHMQTDAFDVVRSSK